MAEPAGMRGPRAPLLGFVRALLLTLCLLGLSTPSIAAEPRPDEADAAKRPCVPARAGERFRVDFEDVPLSQLARLISCAAERNIMFQPGAMGQKTVTVISARDVSLRDLMGMWHAVLLEHGLMVERRGAFDLVRPAESATP